VLHPLSSPFELSSLAAAGAMTERVADWPPLLA
jgi:hypothetical protein